MCYYCKKHNPRAASHYSINCLNKNNTYSAHCDTLGGQFYHYCSDCKKNTLHCIHQNNSLDSLRARCLCGNYPKENHYKPPKK